MTETLKHSEKANETQEELRSKLSQVFWDIDIKRLDFQKHYRLIITQVLNYGSVDIIKSIFQIYTHEAIKETLKNPSRGVWSPRTYKAFCNLFDIEPDEKAVNVLLIGRKARGKIEKVMRNL